MKLLERFFGKEDKRPKGPTTVKFSELKGWLLEKKEREKKENCGRAKPIVEDILSRVESIKEHTGSLARAECPSEIPKRVRKIVLVSKPEFVKGIQDSVRETENSSREDIREFHRNVNATILGMGKVLAGQGRYLPVAFGDIIQEIAKELKAVSKRNKELKALVPETPLHDSVLENIEGLDNETEKLKELDEGEENVERELEKALEEKEKLMKSYEDFRKSSEFTGIQSLRERLKKLEERKKKTESEMYGYLSPLRRPLKKLKKQMDREDLDVHIDKPLQGFISNDHSLKPIIADLKKAIESGKLKVKDREFEKIERVENNLKELLGLKETHASIEAEISSLSEKLSSLEKSSKAGELMDGVNDLDARLEELKSELEKTKKRRKEIREQISNLHKSIEKSINGFDQEIKLEWDAR